MGWAVGWGRTLPRAGGWPASRAQAWTREIGQTWDPPRATPRGPAAAPEESSGTHSIAQCESSDKRAGLGGATGCEVQGWYASPPVNLLRCTTEYRKASPKKDAVCGPEDFCPIPSGKAPNSAPGHGLTLAEQGGRGSVISSINRATAQPFSTGDTETPLCQ